MSATTTIEKIIADANPLNSSVQVECLPVTLQKNFVTSRPTQFIHYPGEARRASPARWR